MYTSQKKQNTSKKSSTISEFSQESFDNIGMKYIINGLHPLRCVEDESFVMFSSGE